jgi:single-stranded DNA-binding protein
MVMINRVILAGRIGEYGVKISWTEAGKSGEFKSFISVLVVSPQAEALAEQLKPGDMVLLEGKLQYKAGKSKDAGKLVVTTFTVQRLLAAALVNHN